MPPGGGEALPVRDVNAVAAGSRIHYTPGNLPVENPKKAKVALVLVPADLKGSVEVTDPRRADGPAEWKVPVRVGVVGLVFGPQGLDRKKVRHLVTDDADLMLQLAEYAEKTTQAENLLQALAAYDRQPGSRQNLDAALTGFAGAWRLPMSRLDGTTSLDQQAAVLLRTLNPALSSFDPLAPQGTTKFQQTAGLATAVAGLFWGNTVGLAAGSTALFMNLRTMMFPNTDFRSTYVQPASDTLSLCAPREAQKPRTRLAYLWAVKMPNLDPPHLALARTAHLGIGLRNMVKLKGGGWEGRFLLRARDWKLVRQEGSDGYPVRVLPANTSGALSGLQVDLSETGAPPGEYRLHGRWDWTDFNVEGPVQVHKIGPLESAELTPKSQDRLVTGGGTVLLDLVGADFEFVQKAVLRKEGDPPSRAAGLEIVPQEDANGGPKTLLRLLADTSALSAGKYFLRLEQAGGQVSEIPLRVLPPNPVLEPLPVRANLREPEQVLSFHGRGLDRLQSASTTGASVELLEGSATERTVRIRLSEGARKGDRIALRLKVEGLHDDLEVEDALIVAGPRPKILSLSASTPPESTVEVREGELVAGVPRTFSVHVQDIDNTLRALIGCEDRSRTLAPLSLRGGEQQGGAMLQQTGPDTLFLSLEPGAIGPPGCRLALTVETGEGSSDPKDIGAVVRLPRIEKFEFTEEKTADGLYVATLEGYELDTISRTGWNRAEGFPVLGLPAPVPGHDRRQALRVALPWPAPSPLAPLYVFLHKETAGRLTKTHL